MAPGSTRGRVGERRRQECVKNPTPRADNRSVTMSANSWAPSDDAEDPSLIDRLEQMIAPSFDDADLPRPADPSAELPWMSGGHSAAIAPEFDTEGLPQVAGVTPSASTLPALPPPPAFAAPAATAPVATLPLAAPGPMPPPAPLSPLAAPGASFAAPMAPVATSSTATADTGATSPPPPPPLTGAEPPLAWGAPDPSSAVPLPSPDQVREARERAMSLEQRRPRTPLLVGLAASVVALVAMGVVVVGGGGSADTAPIAVLAPEVDDAAEATPLVLPSFTAVAAEWRSMTVRFETSTGTGRRTIDLSGPSDLAVVSVIENIVPSDPSQELVSEQRIVTRKAEFVSDGETWSRDKSSDGSAYTVMSQRLVPRSFDDVIPVEARPLVDVLSVEDLDDAGTRRYTLDLRTATFATQYPALFDTWSELNLWSASVGERASVVVDVDETGLVRSTTIEATDGPVTLSSVLSSDASPVSVPPR